MAEALHAEDAAARAIYVPIAYGSVSHWLGRKPGSNENNHRWTVYVRSPDRKHLGYAIKKVTFLLHPTFASSRREITEPPFEVTEHGWGAFDIGITIEFQDAAAAPVNIVHKLKLYPLDGSGLSHDKPVVDDHYDELVFNEIPSDPAARAALLAGPTRPQPPHTDEALLPVYDDTGDVERIRAARIRLAHDYKELQERLDLRRQEAVRMREDLRALGLT